MMFKAGNCLLKPFLNFSIFISLCGIVFFFITLVSDSKETAKENALGASPEAPVEGSVPEGMVLIPAGDFQMGSTYKVAHHGPVFYTDDMFSDEKPVHTVYVAAFYMDTYEVTNAAYQAFVAANPEWRKGEKSPVFTYATNYLHHWDDNGYPEGEGEHPVRYVPWHAAMAYAKWAGKRLPTEAEWEKAARGGLLGKMYPHGDTIDKTRANYDDNVFETTPVGSYPANGYGLYDMAGNVSEWCLDAHDANFYATSRRENPLSGADTIAEILEKYREVKSARVLRGGSWSSPPPWVRVACRSRNAPGGIASDFGFRCVKDVSP